jgi:hypothetical protein
MPLSSLSQSLSIFVIDGTIDWFGIVRFVSRTQHCGEKSGRLLLGRRVS